MISKTGQIFKNLYFPFEVFDILIISKLQLLGFDENHKLLHIVRSSSLSTKDDKKLKLILNLYTYQNEVRIVFQNLDTH